MRAPRALPGGRLDAQVIQLIPGHYIHPTYNIASLTSPTYRGRFLVDDVRSRWQGQFGVRLRF